MKLLVRTLAPAAAIDAPASSITTTSTQKAAIPDATSRGPGVWVSSKHLPDRAWCLCAQIHFATKIILARDCRLA